MKTLYAASLALAGILAITAGANAASRAFATTDVNLRAGPSTDYPAVNVVGAGDNVQVFGCLSTRAWCDVGYDGQRGWMSSSYLADDFRVRRYTGTRIVERINAPIISFSVGRYWDNHYRGRGFYRERARYSRPDFRPSPIIRQERREDRRQDAREDRRDDRRDARQDLRQDRRQDRRDDRRDARQDRRDDRGPGRGGSGRGPDRGPGRNDGPAKPLYRVN